MEDQGQYFPEKNATLFIIQETDPFDPRKEYDHITTMICFHNRYNLGDKHDLKSSDFNGWDELQEYIEECYEPLVISPIYMYDHSGITISTGPFSCPWDSGRIGFVFITKESCEEAGTSYDDIEMLNRIIEGEVEEYDHYLRGDVWGFVIREGKHNINGEIIDSCWGFYGYDYCKTQGEDTMNTLPDDIRDEYHMPLKAYKTAIEVQDACNSSGVAISLANFLKEFLGDTDAKNRHPITVLFTHKLCHLAGIDVDITSFSKAYDAAKDFIEKHETK